MIYLESSIAPEEGEEYDVLSVSIIRNVDYQNDKGEYKYIYGGWMKQRNGERKYFNGEVYSNRSNNIVVLQCKILKDISDKMELL